MQSTSTSIPVDSSTSKSGRRKNVTIKLQSLYRDKDCLFPFSQHKQRGEVQSQTQAADCLDKIIDLQKKFDDVKNDVNVNFDKPRQERAKMVEQIAPLYFNKRDRSGNLRPTLDL